MDESGLHRFEFDAKKGQKLVFDIEARRLDSALDPVLTLTDAKGKALAEAQAKKLNNDPELTYTVVSDGLHRLEVRDLHDTANPRRFYRLRATLSEPDFTLTVAADRFKLTPGKPLDIPVTINRRNGFTGEVALAIENLPAGIEAAGTTLKAASKNGTLKLTANAAASTAFRITGRSQAGLVRTAAAPAPDGAATTQLWLTAVK